MQPDNGFHIEQAELFGLIEAAVNAYSPQLTPPMCAHLKAELRHAHRELLQGRGADAVAEARAIAELTHLPAAQLLWAWMLLETNQPVDAMDALFALEQFQPGLAEAHLFKGLVLYTLDQRAEAQSVLRKAVQCQPGLLAGWKLLMHMALEAEHRNAASLILHEALRYSMRHPQLLSLQSCLRHEPEFAPAAVLPNGWSHQLAAIPCAAAQPADLFSVPA